MTNKDGTTYLEGVGSTVRLERGLLSEAKKYGWYSAEAEKKFGSVIWLTPEGGEITVTCVDTEERDYAWPDKVCLGEVTCFVRLSDVDYETKNDSRYNPSWWHDAV